MQKSELQRKCEECGGDIVFSGGEHVCGLCGLVQMVDKRVYVNYNSAPDRLHLIDGLGSYIDFRDAKGDPLPRETHDLFNRLKNYDKREKISNHFSEYRALWSLRRVAENLRLEDQVRDYAAYLYRKAVRNGKMVSTHSVLMAVCVYLAMKETYKTRPVKVYEVINAFDRIGRKVVIKSFNRCVSEMHIIGIHLKPRRSEDYLSTIFQRLLSSEEFKRRLKKRGMDLIQYCDLVHKTSIDILNQIDKGARGSKNPYNFAASTVYLASHRVDAKGDWPILTQGLLAEISGVAEYSIRDTFSKIKKVAQ